VGSRLELRHNILSFQDISACVDFYVRVLGMGVQSKVQHGDISLVRLGYGEGSDVQLECIGDCKSSTKRCGGSREDVYWKIGLCLPDVALTAQNLREKGVDVSEAAQFRDIGFLCHLSDPETNGIELLQHDFGSNFKKENSFDAVAKSKATIGQITLRIKDPVKSLSFYRDLLGMKLLAKMDVEPYKFSLYFLACTDDEPPSSDLEALENREWLWKRKYTTLELQHRWGSEEKEEFAYNFIPWDVKNTIDNSTGITSLTSHLPLGFCGIGFTTHDISAVFGMADDEQVLCKPFDDQVLQSKVGYLADPDSVFVRISEI